jgi:hypothetical protein
VVSPVARPLPTQDNTEGFGPTIPVFEWAKTFHALDRTATLIRQKILRIKEVTAVLVQVFVLQCKVLENDRNHVLKALEITEKCTGINWTVSTSVYYVHFQRCVSSIPFASISRIFKTYMLKWPATVSLLLEARNAYKMKVQI